MLAMRTLVNFGPPGRATSRIMRTTTIVLENTPP